MNRLARYRAMRDFTATSEPEGGSSSGIALRYSVQMHEATRLHWDLRLEWQGVLLSWAVTRGPSTDPVDKRLAVRTEDHPFDYLTFEGCIPKGSYGAGTVLLWDLGWWEPHHDVNDGLATGHLHFALHGQRATGGWSLVRMKDSEGARENWLLVKDNDAAARRLKVPFAETHATSVSTGRTLSQIATNTPGRHPGRKRKGPTPGFRAVQLAETVDSPPDGANWLHEVKLDGYRGQVAIGRGGVRIRTRSGADWSELFAELIPPLADLPCDTALIDGEIVAGAGLSGFAALQSAIKAGGPFRYYAFDLLEIDGVNLAELPLTERRKALARLLSGQPERGFLQLSPAIDGAADQALATVCDAGGEGLVSKLADAPYRGGRSTAWVKSKCVRRSEFVIVGWQPSPSRGRPFASLLLAAHEDGKLAYRGKVGTGWDGDDMQELAGRLRPLQRKRPPLRTHDVISQDVRWTEPHLVAEIAYAERTPAGLLRHARFVALREDKPASEVEEKPVKSETNHDPARPPVAGIGISSPQRIVFPDIGLTKLALAEYYADMADRILPTLADRPLSLLRLPDGLGGEQFFQKHATAGFPDAIRRVPVADPDGTSEDWMAVNDAAGLVAAVQMGAVEFHPWGAKIDKPERPDRLVFDLDPDESLVFADVRSAALSVRDRLADLGLGSWALLSGGKGIHVIVRLRRSTSWETAKVFSQLFAEIMAEAEPKRFTATLSKRARAGRIFIDWMRNERGATAVAPFTVRARKGAPVAIPVAWDELATIKRADAFSIHAARERSCNDVALPPAAALNARLLTKIAASRTS